MEDKKEGRAFLGEHSYVSGKSPVLFSVSCRTGRLPLYRIGENHPVGGVFGGEGRAAVLYAEHDERFRPVVAHGAPSGRGHAYYAAFLYGERLAVYLEFTLSREEEVEFFVGLVRVEEARLRAGTEHLEGKFASRGAYGCSAEDFARDFRVGAECEFVVRESAEFAYAGGAEVLSCRDFFDLFHRMVV